MASYGQRLEAVVATLPASSDFEAGSSVLSVAAQERLQTSVEAIHRQHLDSILVTGFANAAAPEQSKALGLERARSVRAFFILNGIEPSLIHMDYVDFKDLRHGRPGQVQFEVVEKFTR